jgi:hypothetical protein
MMRIGTAHPPTPKDMRAPLVSFLHGHRPIFLLQIGFERSFCPLSLSHKLSPIAISLQPRTPHGRSGKPGLSLPFKALLSPTTLREDFGKSLSPCCLQATFINPMLISRHVYNEYFIFFKALPSETAFCEASQLISLQNG